MSRDPYRMERSIYGERAAEGMARSDLHEWLTCCGQPVALAADEEGFWGAIKFVDGVTTWMGGQQ